MRKNSKVANMLKKLIITISILCSCLSYGGSNYQIDLILFTQPHSASDDKDLDLDSPFIPISKNAISLKNDSSKFLKPFHLLPPTKSALRDEYYLLNRKHQYQILGQYSWIQPKSNQGIVALPMTNKNGWQMQGTVKVIHNTFFDLDSELQLSPPSNPQSSFTVVQKQRLKENVVYYLDHAQLGMLIKIHRVA